MAGHVNIRQASVNALLRSPTGPVYRHVDGIARKTVNAAKRRAPVRSGHLRTTGGSIGSIDPGRVTGRAFFTANYARAVIEGTGIYGPKGQPIRPKRGKFLKFTGKRGVVFVREVKGSKPNNFLVEAFRHECPYPVRVNPTA